MPPDAAPVAPAVPAEKRHLILSLARPEAYVPMARSILGRIGYAILSPEEWRENDALGERAPELCILDERQLAELTAGSDIAATPLVVLSGRGRAPIEDRRVVGVVARPAGLHELFRLFQEALEPIARGSLRALTNRRRAAPRDAKALCSRSPRTAAWSAHPSRWISAPSSRSPSSCRAPA
jgi:hypothetical protein